MEIPVLSEFVQYGVVGIALALIVALVIIVKSFIVMAGTFVEVLKGLYAELGNLRSTIADLTAQVKLLTWTREFPGKLTGTMPGNCKDT